MLSLANHLPTSAETDINHFKQKKANWQTSSKTIPLMWRGDWFPLYLENVWDMAAQPQCEKYGFPQVWVHPVTITTTTTTIITANSVSTCTNSSVTQQPVAIFLVFSLFGFSFFPCFCPSWTPQRSFPLSLLFCLSISSLFWLRPLSRRHRERLLERQPMVEKERTTNAVWEEEREQDKRDSIQT